MAAAPLAALFLLTPLVEGLPRIVRVDVLVLDDFAIAPVTDSERRDLLEDRYDLRSTVITSQLPPDRWHDYLADPTPQLAGRLPPLTPPSAP